jgi:metallo-beta-lactamase family protein
MKLTFHGGVRIVTGANYLLESDETKILIDCGLRQGSSFSEAQNFEPFPYDPREIAAVFVTHPHIDHIGRIPQLYKSGFRGKIYSVQPAKDIAELLLLDSEHILREEAEKKGRSPLYEINDVLETMKLWEKRRYHERVEVGPFTMEFYNAGHILGSSYIKVTAEGKSVVFSGDLGNMPPSFITPIEYLEEADYALIESTYGARIHDPTEKRRDELEDLIEETIKAGGVLMIPAFALERTQGLLYELNELVENRRIPIVPIFIDSPLAIKLTSVYQKYSHDADYFSKEAIELIRSGDALFNFRGLKMTLTTEQSKEINNVPPPKVIVAGAGMSNGGRILHHERRYLSDPKNAILFIGYQAKGSLGRLILDGAKEVKIFGEKVPVRCRVKAIGGYSAHADQPQLLDWLRPMRNRLKKVFVVQGEEEEALPLVQKIKDELAIEAVVPTVDETAVL